MYVSKIGLIYKLYWLFGDVHPGAMSYEVFPNKIMILAYGKLYT